MTEIEVMKIGGKVQGLESVADAFSLLRNGKYQVLIKRADERRSVDQNALMWMWFTCIAADTQTPVQDVHDYYCKELLSRPVIFNGRTEVVSRGTSGLSKAEFTEFLNKVQADAAAELGITLPTPEDRAFEMFYQEYGKR